MFCSVYCMSLLNQCVLHFITGPSCNYHVLHVIIVFCMSLFKQCVLHSFQVLIECKTMEKPSCVEVACVLYISDDLTADPRILCSLTLQSRKMCPRYKTS